MWEGKCTAVAEAGTALASVESRLPPQRRPSVRHPLRLAALLSLLAYVGGAAALLWQRR